MTFQNPRRIVELKARTVIKGEKHHWWPEGLSKYWVNENGKVLRISVTGDVISSTPNKLAKISDGHNILFENGSPWQSTIEQYFDKPDSNIPNIVDWLRSFNNKVRINDGADQHYPSQEAECENLDILRECLISLIVRSPRYRNAQDSFVRSIRGDIEKSESKMLIAANIQQKYSSLIRSSKGVGKFALLFTENFEFIYGDGVYSNIGSATENLFGLKVVMPITPNIAVIWSSPMSCRTFPRLIAIKADREIVETVNNSIQVYSKEYLFFRTQQPILIDAFKLCEHRIYRHDADPIDRLIESLIPNISRQSSRFLF